MSLHGAPMLAQNPITRLRSTTNEAELNAMRAAAWHRHGVASIVVDDITDPWLRQAITNEANRRCARHAREALANTAQPIASRARAYGAGGSANC